MAPADANTTIRSAEDSSGKPWVSSQIAIAPKQVQTVYRASWIVCRLNFIGQIVSRFPLGQESSVLIQLTQLSGGHATDKLIFLFKCSRDDRAHADYTFRGYHRTGCHSNLGTKIAVVADPDRLRHLPVVRP